jgi:xylitol oxidase
LEPHAKATDLGNGDRTTWARNYAYRADSVLEPANAAEVQQAVKSLARVKALGTMHSFNDIADSAGTQISLRRFTQKTLDRNARTVTVGAGVTYGELATWLDAQGFAVHNLASLPHISVAGACATATHGSGIGNGNLATAAAAIEFVDGRGEIVLLSRAGNSGEFQGAVVSLGALGIVTAITLDIIPSFEMTQTVYENLAFDELEGHLEAILGSGYSVSLFTDWQNHRATQVWIKQIRSAPAAPAPSFHGATLQKTKLHPLPGHSPENCTEQEGKAGPWYDRLPHFRMNFTPSSGAELQSEYFVPRDRAYRAILAVEGLREKITPHLFITELRAIAADDLWMSMAYGRDSVGIHFTWKQEWNEVRPMLPRIEERLEPFEARPHWGKLFTMPGGRLKQLYPRFADFLELANRHDPEGKFRNEFLERNLYRA